MSYITLHFCLSTSRPAHITQTYDETKTFIPADSNGPQGGLLVLKQSQLNADELTSPSVRREAVSVFSSVIRTNPGHQSELSGCSPVVRHDSNGSSVCSSAFVHRGRQNQQRTAKEKVPRCSFKSKEVTLGGVILILLDLTSVSTSIATTSLSLISRMSEDVRRSSRQCPQNNKCLMILLSPLSVQIF